MKTVEALAQWLAYPLSQAEKPDRRHLTHLCDDSRDCVPGSVFLAVTGGARHGLQFVRDALCQGAALILSDRPAAAPLPVPAWVVPDLAQRRAQLARWFYDAPDERLQVLGVTGTNGKSSTVWYIAQLLTHLGVPTGVMGTLGWGRYPALRPARNTTPGAVALYRALHGLTEEGVEAVAMEVSSHAIVQGRIEGLRFAGLGLTQVTRDHLDFHGSDAAYRAAKARLFTHWPSAFQALNLDDETGRALAAQASRPLTYGFVPQADWFVEKLDVLPVGLAGVWRRGGRRIAWKTPLMGRFNAENLTCAAAMVSALSGSLDWLPALPELKPVPGRMMRLAGRPTVIVDYAHTPDALAQVLIGVREHFPRRRLWAVFGAGGDRDQGKRPLMGAAADRHADRIVLTSDNPRCEPPERIMAQVAAGIRHTPFKVVPDRARAIQTVLQCAHADDVVVIAGKGHETWQEFCREKRPFSDRDEAIKWIRR